MSNVTRPLCPHPKCQARMVRAYVRQGARFIPHHWVCPECENVIHPTIFRGDDQNIAFRMVERRPTRSTALIPQNTHPISGNGRPHAPGHFSRRSHKHHRFSPMPASAIGTPVIRGALSGCMILFPFAGNFTLFSI